MKDWNSILITISNGQFDSGSEDVVWYRTFGNYDAISIRPFDDLGFKKEEIDNNLVFETMWDKTLKMTEKLTPGESIQNLFAVMGKDSNPKVSLEDFWALESSYLFASMLQIKCVSQQDEPYDKQIDRKIIEISEYLDKYTSLSYKIYLSLDCCDLILFIKSDSYFEAENCIHKIQMEFEYAHYSYSICGMDLQRICNSETEEVLPKLTICAVFSKAQNYQLWYEKFVKEYRGLSETDDQKSRGFKDYQRLGNEDVCINIFNYSIKDHAKQILNGVLSQRCDELTHSLVRLRIHLDVDFSYFHNQLELEKNTDGISCIGNDKICKGNENIEGHARKALFEILNACSHLEKKCFALDVQDCIRNIFPQFVEKIEQYSDAKKFDIAPKDSLSFKDSVRQFTEGIMSIVNGSLHADRMFFQVPGFNAVLYDIPSKLLMYYTAYMQRTIDVLNHEDETKIYKSLLCPDLYFNTAIVKLFDYERIGQKNDSLKISSPRIFKANVPVKRLFEPRTLMQELCHEAAHFSGNNLRRRSVRTKYMIKMLADIIFSRITYAYNPAEKAFYSLFEFDKDFSTEVIKYIEDQIRNSFKNKIKEESRKFVEGEAHHQYVTKNTLFDIVYELLHDEAKLDKLFSCIEGLIDRSTQSTVEFVLNLQKLFIIYKKHIWILKAECFDIVEDVHMLTYESYADLILLNVLQLESVEYLEHFCDYIMEEKIEEEYSALSANGLGERILSIIKSKGEDINALSASQEKYEDYLENLKRFADEKTVRRYLTKNVIEYNTQYLKKCQEKIDEVKSAFEPIREVYDEVTGKDFGKCISYMRRETALFQKNIS